MSKAQGLACDFNAGVPLMDGGTVRLHQLIGLSRAMDMILTGRPVDAKEAYSFGIILVFKSS